MVAGKTVVYTSGTFDMLHINHLRLIEYARGLGDILIVGVNSDELVASYKSMPIVPFEDRIALMRAIKGPDLVIPQHSLDHNDKVKKLHMDVFVVGDDWVGKYDYLEKKVSRLFIRHMAEGLHRHRLRERYPRNTRS